MNLESLKKDFETGAIDLSQNVDLPTFGGDEPADTVGIFSWDTTSLLIRTRDGFEIVPRTTALETDSGFFGTVRRAT